MNLIDCIPLKQTAGVEEMAMSLFFLPVLVESSRPCQVGKKLDGLDMQIIKRSTIESLNSHLLPELHLHWAGCVSLLAFDWAIAVSVRC